MEGRSLRTPGWVKEEVVMSWTASLYALDCEYCRYFLGAAAAADA